MKWNGWVLFAVCAVSVDTQVGAVSKMHAHASSMLRMRAPRPQQFLLISSPREMKVVYSVVTPGQAAGSKVAPIVDSGLLGPQGPPCFSAALLCESQKYVDATLKADECWSCSRSLSNSR